MGTPNQPLPVKPFIAVMHGPQTPVDELLARLAAEYGPLEDSYGPVPFVWSSYYAGEMGEGLVKRYCCCGRLIDRDSLPAIKRFTNGLEAQWAREGKRSVNIDPGYIARDKLVLASTKDFYHRLYLGDGIYGEVTLHFRKGIFRHFSWTYPDYQDAGVQEFLMKARTGLVHGIRS